MLWAPPAAMYEDVVIGALIMCIVLEMLFSCCYFYGCLFMAGSTVCVVVDIIGISPKLKLKNGMTKCN